MCLQETRLRTNLEFVIPGDNYIGCDRIETQDGGCVTFIKDTIAYRQINVPNEFECMVIEICSPRGNIKLVNHYNPYKKLSLQTLHMISENVSRREIWCGYLMHTMLYGGDHTDKNGEIVEGLIEERSLVFLNNRSGTRVNVTRNTVHHSIWKYEKYK